MIPTSISWHEITATYNFPSRSEWPRDSMVCRHRGWEDGCLTWECFAAFSDFNFFDNNHFPFAFTQCCCSDSTASKLCRSLFFNGHVLTSTDFLTLFSLSYWYLQIIRFIRKIHIYYNLLNCTVLFRGEEAECEKTWSRRRSVYKSKRCRNSTLLCLLIPPFLILLSIFYRSSSNFHLQIFGLKKLEEEKKGTGNLRMPKPNSTLLFDFSLAKNKTKNTLI